MGRRARLCRILRVALAAAVVCLGLAPAARAEPQNPNHGRGFEPEKAYQTSEVDSVNLFNGTLNVTLPIGPSYRLDGGLSYSLTLFYGSNPWEWDQFCWNSSQGQVCQYRSYPTFEDNAGFGWRLHMGRILEPNTPPYNSTTNYVYESPDGATHTFYDSLHEGEPVTGGVRYTRDNSYLRMKDIAAGETQIEFPDGTIHTFTAAGELRKIANRASSWLTVTRYRDGAGRYTQWVLKDSVGRQHDVYFTPSDILLGGEPFDPPVLGNGNDPDWADPAKLVRIDKIVLGQQGGRRAHYDFVYEDDNHPDREFTAPRQRDSQGNFGPQLVYTVPVLVSINLPDTSAWFVGKNNYDTSGRITRLTYPTGGSVKYEYGTYIFPKIEPFRKEPLSNQESPYESNRGVAKRTFLSPANGVTGIYVYNQAFSDATRTKTVVTDPLGHRRHHHFRADNTTSYYGLPLHPTLQDANGRWLSMQTEHANGTILRSEYVRYEMDRVYTDPDLGNNAWMYDVNRRVASTNTVYHDDGYRARKRDLSDFDGLGHYRHEYRHGTLGGGANLTSYTRYNPGRGSLQHDGGGNFNMLSPSEPWLIGLYDRSWVRSGAGVQYGREACFDYRGLLVRERTQGGATRGTQDVVVTYSRDTKGNVTSEWYHGGDTGSISTGVDACGLGGSLTASNATYVLDHTYQFGGLATTKHRYANWYLLDQTLDKNSALPVSSRDTSGLQTTYEYDNLNRLTAVRPAPGEGAHTEYGYFKATGGSGPSLSVVQRSGAGSLLTQQSYDFDGRGRLIKESRWMPGSVWSRRTTGYDGLGNMATRSTWSQQSTPPYKTAYYQYDPWGRPGRIVPPEGAHHAVDVTYLGERRVERTSTVGVGGSGSNVQEVSITSTEVYDDLGRMFKFWEDDGVTYKLTKYGYDPAGRLSWVDQNDQFREFNYDGRGFLWRECHPEKGTATANGCVRYHQIDPRGHARRIVDGPHDLTYVYNSLEQLTAVQETFGGRPLQEYDYATSNLDASEHGKGKLRSVLQHNYIAQFSDLDFPVEETYRYRGVGGRVSDYETRINTNDVYLQSYAYDELGNISRQQYPSCVHCPASAATPYRVLTPTYSQGLPVGLPDWLSSITYHPSGRPHQTFHVNGVTTTEAADPQGQNRPGSISVWKGSAPLYLSGTFRYDGSGNVTGIGSDYYRYDRLGRLTEGTMYQGGFDRRQTYAYDVHGNMTQVGTFVDGAQTTRGFSVLPQSNRLSNAAYDDAGNQLNYGSDTYSWTSEGRMHDLIGPGKNMIYVYSASGERVLSYDKLTGRSTFRIRDLSGKVVREFGFDGAGTWTWEKDWIHNGGALVGTVDRQGQVLHAHLDHLGSPRVFSNANGISVRQRHFHPFGELAAQSGTAELTMGFTGHERDENLAGTVDDLDYMHQRYYSPQMGRFLSTDPINSADPKRPVSWNKYVYAMGSPVNFTDPTGLYTCSGTQEECTMIETSMGLIRQALENLPEDADEDRGLLEGVIAFYGQPGEENGVEITVDNSINASGNANFKKRFSGLFKREAFVPISINLQIFQAHRDPAVLAAGTLAHEGQHGIDSLVEGKAPSFYQTLSREFRANRTQGAVFRGHNYTPATQIWSSNGGYNPAAIVQRSLQSTRRRCKAMGYCS